MNEFFYLESLVSAFRVAIIPKRSKRLSQVNRDLNKRFINWVNKLLKIKTDVDSKDKNLLVQIEAAFTPNKTWLTKKIKEAILEKSK